MPYSIAELSDGERNALLIAANVLTVQPGTLVLIDEPERHLHRSIISPLLTLLFAERLDCAFVISTHEVMLPIDNSPATTLLVRGCTYEGNAVAGWDVDVLKQSDDVDEALRRDIFGARRQVLFVEGQGNSLDKALYSLVFPEVSVVARASCRDVEQAVVGIRSAPDLHWIGAFGVVDGDRRSNHDVAKLKAKGIYALAAYSVESVYYNEDIRRRVAERHASVVGGIASERLEQARTAALTVIANHVRRLSERAVERDLRDQVLRLAPGRKDIVAAARIDISIDVAAVVQTEMERLELALSEGRLEDIINEYPVRETPALKRIAEELGFQGRAQYEAAVRQLLLDDPVACDGVRILFGTLAEDMSGEPKL